MLTRLRVQGFKNLLDVDIQFGPFTCVAGLNAAGKSNLFDAIRLLHLLAEKPIMEAVGQLRHARGRSPEPQELFARFGDYVATEMRFTADMVIDPKVEDDFGVEAEAVISTVQYVLALRLGKSGLVELSHESLRPISQSEAERTLRSFTSTKFRRSVIAGRRTKPFISSSDKDDAQEITVHQEGHGGRRVPAPKSQITVVGGMANADFPTILAVNREMRAWRTMMLEPSSMRAPSFFRDDRFIDARGANLPNAVYRLTKSEKRNGRTCAEVANRLSRLVDDVRAVRVVEDERTETRIIEVSGADGVFHPAHALSDGTLRFLVLTLLDLDPEAKGLICLEEPENGIHPERVRMIVQLLQDIAVDRDEPVGDDNPLRQVIINTHSPLVVQSVFIDDLVYMDQAHVPIDHAMGTVATVRVPPGSWRARHHSDHAPLVKGTILSYLGRGRGMDAGQSVFDWMTNEGPAK